MLSELSILTEPRCGRKSDNRAYDACGEGNDMSSLYATARAVEEFLQNGNDNAAQDACAFAEDIISQHWPKDGENPPAICCFTIENNVLWCHDHLRAPLYAAPIAERPALCKACREDCKKRLAVSRETLNRRKNSA